MRSLYVSQQGCYLNLDLEVVVISHNGRELERVQLPLIEQILIFGYSQVTTQVMRECLKRDIPIAYLSRMGYCCGRLIAIERGYRQLSRYQQELSFVERLLVARQIVWAKIRNGRVLLLRQERRLQGGDFDGNVEALNQYADRALRAESIEELLGIEGTAANCYFAALAVCLTSADFVFGQRSRRPPLNPVNAMLSFGYTVVWNHLLSLLELQGLDPYVGCLHQGSERHAALASDLLEEFRSPIVDSLVLYLINRQLISAVNDFEYRDGGCFLNDAGRKKFLRAFVQRMEEKVAGQPRWNLLMQQVREFKRFVYQPVNVYQPYLIR